MHATGEVMATACDVATALAKAERAAGRPLPIAGSAVLCIGEDLTTVEFAHQLVDAGVRVHVWPQPGAPADLEEQLPSGAVVGSNDSSSFQDLLRRTDCALVVATAADTPRMRELRQAAVAARVPLVTSRAGAASLARALAGVQHSDPVALQDYTADTLALSAHTNGRPPRPFESLAVSPSEGAAA
jgi:hypothetical protein